MWRCIAALALAVGVAGCLTASSNITDAGVVSRPRPLDGATSFTAAEMGILHRATELLVANCMAARDLHYRVVPDVDHMRSAAANPYELLDIDLAAKDGYGMTAELLNQAHRTPVGDLNDQWLEQMPEDQRGRWREALVGSAGARKQLTLPDGTTFTYPTDGCIAQARSQIYGPDWDYLYSTFQGYANLIILRTRQDQRYQRTIGTWSACMRAAGYQYQTLDGPREEISNRLAAATAQGVPPDLAARQLRETALFEFDIARQDAQCERKVRLDQAVAAAQADADRATLSPSVRTQLAALRVARDQAVARARAMLSQATP